MSKGDYFFVVFFLTILAVRIFLYVKPIASPTIKGFRLHHYMYGLALLITAVFLQSTFLFAVGTGLFLDEATFLAIRGKDHRANYSKTSLIGTSIFVIIVFIFRNGIVNIFLR